MSNLLEGKVFVKISELDATTTFDTNDEFVLVRNGVTVKTAGIDFVDTVVSIGNLATKSYTDAAVAALVNSAPTALDTLSELSAALNNDADFASTITNQLALKLNVGDFGLYFWNELNAITTYHVAEGTNLYYTEERVDANFATKNTDALAEGTTNLYFTSERFDQHFGLKTTDRLIEGYYNLWHTDARARASVFDNRDIIVFQNGGEVGNAQLQHQELSGLGMDIYSPATHEWVQLNYDDRNYVWVTDSFAGVDVGTHSWRFNADGTLTLAAGPTNSTHAATKGYVDTQISNIEIPVSLNDLTNVAISSPASGQVLKYNGSAWVNGTDETGSGGGGVGPTPTFTTVTTTNLNVQNVTFTGTGAVTITSGNDLNFVAAGSILANGSSVITKAQLKAVVAASTDFADFKARIAAL